MVAISSSCYSETTSLTLHPVVASSSRGHGRLGICATLPSYWLINQYHISTCQILLGVFIDSRSSVFALWYTPICNAVVTAIRANCITCSLPSVVEVVVNRHPTMVSMLGSDHRSSG